MKKVLVIVGHTGAGKSTVCEKLAKLYGIPLISFAEVGKKFSNNLGYKRIRECYKSIGVAEFKNVFSKYFFDRISECLKESDSLLVDGLYLDDIATKLRESYETLYVYIEVPEGMCITRVAERLNESYEQVEDEYRLKENLKETLGNTYIINTADIIINGAKSKEDVCEDIINLCFLT